MGFGPAQGAATNPLRLREINDPEGLLDIGQIYTNDISGVTELMYLDNEGREIQVTNDGELDSPRGAPGTAFANGGNSFGADAFLGLNDSFTLNLETANITRLQLTTGA